MITLQSLVMTLVYLLVAGIIAWVLWWAINKIDPPEPFKKIAIVIWVLLVVLVVCGVLLNLVGIQLIKM